MVGDLWMVPAALRWYLMNRTPHPNEPSWVWQNRVAQLSQSRVPHRDVPAVYSSDLKALLARIDNVLKRGQKDFARKEQYSVLLELRRLFGCIR